MSEFILPGYFGGADSDEAVLHQGGLDSYTLSHDDVDTFGNDPDIGSGADNAAQWRREQLPQFGPPFVTYVAEEFSKLQQVTAQLLGKWSYEPTTIVLFSSMQTDASGNVNRAISPNAILYEPPPGFTLALHRLLIGAGGFNFGTPFNAAAAYWELRVNDEAIDGGSLVAGSGGALPFVYSKGTRDAPRARDGEVLSLFISGTAALANKTITVRGQGTLDRNEAA
jgi:hypothetical protein